MADSAERIQKYLARHGYGSRRQVEDWIRAGRLTINGRPAELGATASARDQITLDGRRLSFTPAEQQVIMYRKRVGEIVTRSDPQGRPSIFSRLPKLKAGRWISVGRLDINTSGLLLLTTDGELAQRLMHPATELEREYAVRVHGVVTPEMLTQLREGIELDDGPARFDTLVTAGGQGSNQWFHVTVKQGRNRVVRRLWEAVDCEVSRLIRVRFGPISLPSNLASSRSRPLDVKEVKALLQAVRD